MDQLSSNILSSSTSHPIIAQSYSSTTSSSSITIDDNNSNSPVDTVSMINQPQTFRDLLVDFFRIYDPSRLSQIDDLLIQYYTNEDPINSNSNTSMTDISPIYTIKENIYKGYYQLIKLLESEYNVPGAFITYIYNYRSIYYQPLASLYTPYIIPPYPFTIPFDNIHKASVLLPAQQQKMGSIVRLGVLHSSEAKSQDNLWKSGKYLRILLH